MKPIDMDGIEYIRVVSRRGHYNFCNPSQETVSTHISVVVDVVDMFGRHMTSSCQYINVTTDDIITSNNIDEMISLVDGHISRCFSTGRDKEIEFKNYLVDNQDRLDYGNNLKRYNQILKQREAIDKEVDVLSKEIRYYEEEQSKFVGGAWVTIDQRRP